ncbi:GntR family transcriptional regulator [Microbacterium foliorum]|uniref:GntR family transcriptional regulator n=1 Tax=Microbacterium foliorum TaxID=104336 RepID=UPI0028D0D8D9|nr:GntR family transcriptional regulator [Microbacterium foliorum]
MTIVSGASKSEQAYSWIRSRISGHVFGPGYRLVLGSLAEELGMSVVPVREAIRRLEAEGLVTFERNVGARVTLVDESEYAHTMETLGLVEGAATALSAPLLDRAALDAAAEVNERMTQMLDHLDAHAFTELNRRFHSVLFEPCPNPHVLDLVHRGWARLSGIRDSTFAYVPGRARHSVEEHTQILELIRAGADPLEIELAARNHRLRTRDAFLDALHTRSSRTTGEDS